MVISTPDVIHCRREEMDFIVLGCDGVWEKYSNEAIVERILDRLQRNMEPHNILEELFKELLKKDEEGYSCSDNLSAILVVF
jgi:protein phosphatase 2C family protein 2/3